MEGSLKEKLYKFARDYPDVSDVSNVLNALLLFINPEAAISLTGMNRFQLFNWAVHLLSEADKAGKLQEFSEKFDRLIVC